MSRRRPAIDRFADKIALTANGCIEWMAGTTGTGYDLFSIGRNLKALAHRWSYEHHVGPIPDGLHLDHLCRNTLCVNPAHLEPVTSQENTLRGVGVSAVHAAKTECINGHALAGDNLTFRTNGRWRVCRECKRERDRRSHHKRKAA